MTLHVLTLCLLVLIVVLSVLLLAWTFMPTRLLAIGERILRSRLIAFLFRRNRPPAEVVPRHAAPIQLPAGHDERSTGVEGTPNAERPYVPKPSVRSTPPRRPASPDRPAPNAGDSDRRASYASRSDLDSSELTVTHHLERRPGSSLGRDQSGHPRLVARAQEAWPIPEEPTASENLAVLSEDESFWSEEPIEASPWTEESMDSSAPLFSVPVSRSVQAGPASSAQFSAASHTARGGRRENQDGSVFTRSMLAVADGVGGRRAGREASSSAIDLVQRLVPDNPEVNDLVGVVGQINDEVLAAGSRDPALNGMACTLEVVCLTDSADGPQLRGVHIGDSAVWIIHHGARPRQMTTPHNTDSGRLSAMIGLNGTKYQPWDRLVQLGDRVILATDGLWADLSHESVGSLLHSVAELRPADAAHLLVQAAELAGGSDNITVVVADVLAL